MKMHLYGLPENPKMLLIHGVLMPWQIWEPQIQYYKEKYHVLVVELDGHTQDKPSRFVSAEMQAQKIEKYCEDRQIDTFAVVCGLSIGGVIAQILWRHDKLHINHMIIDGAPLVPSGRIASSVMTKAYLKLVHKSQTRDPKTLDMIKKRFLSEQYMEAYLAVVDQVSDTSIENMVYAMCRSELRIDIDNHTKIVYVYGTKASEILAQKSARTIKDLYPETDVVCFIGDSNCYKAVFEPEAWMSVINEFLENPEKLDIEK